MTRGKEIQMKGTMDKVAFEALFRKFFPALMAFSLKYLPDEDDAREVVHNVFINLWDKRASLDASQSLKSYLFTAVHNRSLNVLRDRKKFSDDDLPELSSEENVHEQLESMELEERINEAISGLPEKCRQIFELNRFDGLKYGEIADQLGISVKTVENQMSKALKILREKLAKYLSLVVWILWSGIN
jgi:RNA polymerase sigma-70 factor (ECF subfamily)